MHVTMVKKRLPDGGPCAKCVQAESLLRRRRQWDRIDAEAWASDEDADAPGSRLAATHGVKIAPFFIVRHDDGHETVYTSVLALLREALGDPSDGRDAADVAAADADEIARAAEALRGRTPEEILRWGFDRFGRTLTIAFSGAEDVVLIDMAARLGGELRVFSLDTGRLHSETYRYLDQVRRRYGVGVDVVFPEFADVEELVKNKGFFSFYDDGHEECCRVRKVNPLRRKLATCLAWVTGVRRDQSPGTRGNLCAVELDPVFRGRDGAVLTKICPLLDWQSDRVWAYIREHGVPFNELHSRGFRSIGCEPCTRATLPGEHERAGRWWWEVATIRECGLHVVKLPPPQMPMTGL